MYSFNVGILRWVPCRFLPILYAAILEVMMTPCVFVKNDFNFEKRVLKWSSVDRSREHDRMLLRRLEVQVIETDSHRTHARTRTHTRTYLSLFLVNTFKQGWIHGVRQKRRDEAALPTRQRGGNPSLSRLEGFYKQLRDVSPHNAWVKTHKSTWNEEISESCSRLTGNDGARMRSETARRTRHLYAREGKNWPAAGPSRRWQPLSELKKICLQTVIDKEKDEFIYKLGLQSLDNVRPRHLLRTGKNICRPDLYLLPASLFLLIHLSEKKSE